MLIHWLARLLLAFFALTALLPKLRVGAWWVRGCDFPRLQLAAGALIPIVLVAIGWEGANWYGERGFMMLVGVAIVAWQTSHVFPYTPLKRHEVYPPSDENEPEWIRIVVANLDYTNERKEEMLEALRGREPDLLLLIEATDAWREALSPLKEGLTHECGEPRDEGLGLVLWSKWPFTESEVRFVISERRPSLHTRVQTPSGEVKLICVHPTPPGLIDSTGEDRRDSRVRDAELVVIAKEIQQADHEPCIVTGDFNDVAWSGTTKLFKNLSGLCDPRVGRGLYSTFPARHPLLRFPIDHVFVSPGFAVRQLQRITLPGSDHFGVVVELAPPPFVREEPQPDADDEQRAEEIAEEGIEDAEERGVESDEAKARKAQLRSA